MAVGPATGEGHNLWMDHKRLSRLVADHPLPAALVDLRAFDQNLESLLAVARKAGKAVRLASKSVRCRDLMQRAMDASDGRIHGLMTYSARETAFLFENGFDNLLLAYPPATPADFDTLAATAKKGARLYVMTDHHDQVNGLSVAAQQHKTELALLIDVDMSWRPVMQEMAHVGVRRSPLRTEKDVLPLARFIHQHNRLRFAGIMGYEAQVAGLGDRNPFHKSFNPVKQAIRNLSMPDVKHRRGAIVRALHKEGLACEVINGGGTGSVDYSSADASLTEVTIGSGLLAGHLFDYFHNVSFQPSLMFALAVSRIPAPDMVTCFGGGYVSSGAADPDKLPVPHLPKGLRLMEMEGVGEVQTPLFVPRGMHLDIGEPVFFRPAKSGELAERFTHYLLADENGKTQSVPTYRGDGVCFG